MLFGADDQMVGRAPVWSVGVGERCCSRAGIPG
jgi:hypothetical protein